MYITHQTGPKDIHIKLHMKRRKKLFSLCSNVKRNDQYMYNIHQRPKDINTYKYGTK